MKLKNSYFNNYLLIVLLVHLKYGVVYIGGITGHFELGVSLINNEWSDLRNYYWSDSPLFNILQKILRIEKFENYVVFIYLLTMLILFFIAMKIYELGKLSTVFILSGWLISTSWVFGLVDALLVLLILHIFIDLITKNEFSTKSFFFNSILVFNHFAIAIFINFLIFVLWKKNKFKKLIIILSSFVSGLVLNIFYKSIIGFNGETRLHYLLRPDTIPNLFENNPALLKYVLFSGFYGFVPFLIYFLLTSSNSSKIIIPFVVAIMGSSLAQDTSRIFSYLIIPVILIVIFELNDLLKEENFKYFNSLIIVSFLIVIFVEEYWVIHPEYIFNGKDYGGFSKLIYEILISKINFIIR